jgi:hypothetical protein
MCLAIGSWLLPVVMIPPFRHSIVWSSSTTEACSQSSSPMTNRVSLGFVGFLRPFGLFWSVISHVGLLSDCFSYSFCPPGQRRLRGLVHYIVHRVDIGHPHPFVWRLDVTQGWPLHSGEIMSFLPFLLLLLLLLLLALVWILGCLFVCL